MRNYSASIVSDFWIASKRRFERFFKKKSGKTIVKDMRRVRATIFSIIAIIVTLFIVSQAGEIGAPWPFTFIAAVIIIFIVISLVRTWLRG